MQARKKAIFNWSGGKDSALALYKILKTNEYEIVSLLTTITLETNTSSIHAIPVSLLYKQAEAIGIPLYTVALSKDLKTYEQGMLEAVNHFKGQNVNDFIFGDIFLEDVKAYRESKLNPLGINVITPLWGKTSDEVFNEFLASGIKSKIIVTQAEKLNESYIGKDLNIEFRNNLSNEVDLCGENGEYHTFSYDGPLFKNKVDFEITKVELISYKFTVDGVLKTYDYWQAIL